MVDIKITQNRRVPAAVFSWNSDPLVPDNRVDTAPSLVHPPVSYHYCSLPGWINVKLQVHCRVHGGCRRQRRRLLPRSAGSRYSQHADSNAMASSIAQISTPVQLIPSLIHRSSPSYPFYDIANWPQAISAHDLTAGR